MTPYETFLADPGKIEYWLLDLDVFDTVNRVSRTLYFSNRQYGTGPYDTPPNRAYKARIIRGFEFSATVESVNGPIYGLQPSRSGGSIVLGQTLGDIDLGTLSSLAGVPMRHYATAGRDAVVRHGGFSPMLGRMLTFEEFKVYFTGEQDSQPQISGDTVTIKLQSKDVRFQYPVNKLSYFGCKGAVLFPSGGGQVDCGTDATFNLTSGTFSWEFTLHAKEVPGANQAIINFGLPSTYGYRISYLSTGAIALTTNQSGASQTTTSTAITPGRHNRYSVRLSGAVCSILENGIDITDSAAAHIAPASSPGTMHLYFGRNNAGGTLLTSALLSDIRLWSTSLHIDSVNSRMHRPLDSSEYALTGLLAYWPVDDGIGSTLDQKVVVLGAAGDGTLSAGAVLAPSLMGGTELQGTILPQVWGVFDGFEPVLVDEGTQIFQVHSGSVEALDKVYYGGGAAADAGTAYTDVVSFLQGSTDPAEYDTCITEGGTYVRLGSVPSHPFTVGGQGDNTGGTYRDTVSAIVRFIVCSAGWYPLADPGGLDTASFDTLATDAPASVGYAYKTEQSIANVVNYFLQTVGAVGFFKRETDQFSVRMVKGVDSEDAPTRTITEADIDESDIDILEDNSPVFRVNLRYRRNYKVMSVGDMIEGVAGSEREKYVNKEWRIASQYDSTTKEDYPGAPTLKYDTAFNDWADAMAEAARQLALLKAPSQGFRFRAKQGKSEYDRFDLVYFDFGDFNANSVRQNRYGSGPTRRMYVISVADDAETGGSIITIWRDNA